MDTAISHVSNANKVLKNAFLGVSLELLVFTIGIFSGVALELNSFWIPFIGALALIFILPKFANSMLGFAMANGLSLLMGITLAPAIGMYLSMGMIDDIIMAAVSTLVITVSLSVYAYTTKKDFSFLSGFLLIGLIGIIVTSLLNMFFFKNPIMFMVLNYIGVVLFSLFILYDVSRVVNEKEGNWIMASVSIFLSIINLFMSLLNIMGMSND